ncbi:RING-H2 finger protein ATL79-like [Hibiscus syriacus]|uniref:RING-H2 finger protein ATL79-like n=1 Tax=Hibiscus syriacus TaxID=106335 RepID=A0A6A2WQQ1_HIBSY|nr:RING-H2 finger protein ATL79-like [Hibiscus syriacus]
MAASSSSVTAVRSWRTAFLTLRDETLTNPPSIPHLLQSLIFSDAHSSFISAASDLPAHEVTSDLLFLVQLVANACQFQHDLVPTFSNTCRLIHDLSHRVPLDINSSSWFLLLDSLTKLMDYFLSKETSTASLYKPVLECLETLRHLVGENQRKFSLQDDIQLVNVVLHIIARMHMNVISLYSSSGNQKSAIEMGKKLPRNGSLWEVQTASFTMLGELYSRTGSSFPIDIWQSTIQVFRKLMDLLASKNLVVEEIIMSRFYASLLHCLHLVLMDPKGSISEHVSSFVAYLRMFFVYGLTSGTQLTCAAGSSKDKESVFPSFKLTVEEPKRTNNTPYRPPHLRKKESLNARQAKSLYLQGSSDHISSMADVTSSDSDYSDSDGSLKDINGSRCSKIRVSAIVCVQDYYEINIGHWSNLRLKASNGHSVVFWNDVWLGEVPLKDLFPRLYALSINKMGKVVEFRANNAAGWVWDIQMRRNLLDWEIEQWNIWVGIPPPCVETFLWQVVHQRVAVKEELLKRGVVGIEDPLCLLCGSFGETISHLFLHCEWDDLLLNSCIWKFIPRAVLWTIWKSRNEVIFKKEKLDVVRLFFIACFRILSWFAASFDMHIPFDSLVDGFLKINVDGAMVKGWNKGGIGGLIRDSSGVMIHWFSEKVRGGLLILAKLLAIKRGLSMLNDSCLDLNQRIILESDSSVAVKWIKNPELSNPMFQSLVKEIVSFKEGKDILLRLILRATNWEADRLAKDGIG